MSNFKASLAARILPRSPFGLVRKLSGKKLILPFYHAVSDEPAPHIKHLYSVRTAQQFREDLDFFLRHFAPVGLRDIIESVRTGKDFARESFHVTFDDGLREISEVAAPILQEKGVPATFFLTTDFLDNKKLGYFSKKSLLLDTLKTDSAAAANVRGMKRGQENLLDEMGAAAGLDFDRYLATRKPFVDSQQVRQLLANGFTIGAHSIDHPAYEDISFAEQLRQTTMSINEITQTFSIDYRAFAFPHHDKGVTKHFFDEVFRKKILDVSFGTSGFREDVHPRNLQRLWMEYKGLPPRRRVCDEFLDYALLKMDGRQFIERAA